MLLLFFILFLTPLSSSYIPHSNDNRKNRPISVKLFLFFSFWDIFTRSENLYNLYNKNYNSMMSLIIFVVLDNRWMMAFARRCATSSTRIRFRYSAFLFKGTSLLFDISRERSDESSLNCVQKTSRHLLLQSPIQLLYMLLLCDSIWLFFSLSGFIIKAKVYYQRDLY